MDPAQLIIYGAAAFVMSILSGIAGAGGGFVMTPLGILLGLSPAQAVSSGKFNGLAVTIGSLSGLRSYKGHVSKRRILAVMLLALAIGLLVPFAIKSLDGRLYRLILGGLLLVLITVMHYKKVGLQPREPSRLQQAIGGLLLAISLTLQGIFSGGMGSLVNVVLMGLLGQTANEAQITKRWSQLILNVTIIFGVIGSGLIIWPAVLVGVGGGLVGSYIGGKIAVKEGDVFALNVLMALMAVSAVVLIIGAR